MNQLFFWITKEAHTYVYTKRHTQGSSQQVHSCNRQMLKLTPCLLMVKWIKAIKFYTHEMNYIYFQHHDEYHKHIFEQKKSDINNDMLYSSIV